MEANWFVISIVFIGAIALIIFLIKKNSKDEKELEKELNYFKKPDEEELNDDNNL